ncbi:MAG: cell division protein FtsZ [Patescibacteria group bacterium]|nr:cell division protein FtsZ [Patescibacteria group bacterium]
MDTKIKVVGVGGSGTNAISRMMKCNIKGVELIALNADIQDLQPNKADRIIQIGKKLTKGLGTGMDPEIGREAAEEQKEEIKQALKGADMIFIACGLGGGCGSGASPVVAQIAKSLGALTIAVVTRPFSFEGIQRAEIAENSEKKLKSKVDTLIAISNDKLLDVAEEKITVSEAFWLCDEILRQAVQGISDLIILPGIINIDFADIKAIMKNSGSALFGVGKASGFGRAEIAAKMALNSPLLDISCKGAKGILFNVSGNGDVSLSEVDEVAKIITQEVSSSAKIIFGAIQNEKLKKGEIKVTVIATGF